MVHGTFELSISSQGILLIRLENHDKTKVAHINLNINHADVSSFTPGSGETDFHGTRPAEEAIKAAFGL